MVEVRGEMGASCLEQADDGSSGGREVLDAGDHAPRVEEGGSVGGAADEGHDSPQGHPREAPREGQPGAQVPDQVLQRPHAQHHPGRRHVPQPTRHNAHVAPDVLGHPHQVHLRGTEEGAVGERMERRTCSPSARTRGMPCWVEGRGGRQGEMKLGLACKEGKDRREVPPASASTRARLGSSESKARTCTLHPRTTPPTTPRPALPTGCAPKPRVYCSPAPRPLCLDHRWRRGRWRGATRGEAALSLVRGGPRGGERGAVTCDMWLNRLSHRRPLPADGTAMAL